MEMPEGNSLSNYLKQAKMSVISFTKLENWVPGGLDISETGEEIGKGHRKVNIEQMLITYVYKWENGTC
jgi:hypothetical protein